MCMSSPKTPEVVKVDPEKEAADAAAKAAAAANADAAARRSTRRNSALSTGAGMADTSQQLAGKTTLGS